MTEDAGPPKPFSDWSAPSTASRGSQPTAVPSTALVGPSEGFTIGTDEDLSRPEGLPLFGLHNRDYPSLWALTNLASLTVDEPIPAETYYTAAIGAAWRFGELLLDIEQRNGSKVTALFPTNPEKRKTAEMAFRDSRSVTTVARRMICSPPTVPYLSGVRSDSPSARAMSLSSASPTWDGRC